MIAVRSLLVGAALAVACSPQKATGQVLPADNRDLTVELARQLDQMDLWLDLCGAMRWVQFELAPLGEIEAKLGRIVQALAGTAYFLKIAAIDVDRHYSNLLDEYSRKQRDFAKMKSALELQQKYISIANAAFDLISVVDWYRAALADPRLEATLGTRCPIYAGFEAFNRADVVVEGALGMYSRIDTTSELASNGEVRWGQLKSWDEELKNCGVQLLAAKSMASDAKNLALAFGEANLLQREMMAGRVPMDAKKVAEMRRLGFANLAQLFGKLGLEVAKLQRRELLDRARELDQVIGAEGKPLQAAAAEKEKLYDRQVAAEKLLARAETVRKRFLALHYRLVGDLSSPRVPAVDQKLTWGQALRAYKAQFESDSAGAVRSMAAVNAREAPDGTLTVLTRPSPLARRSSWTSPRRRSIRRPPGSGSCRATRPTARKPSPTKWTCRSSIFADEPRVGLSWWESKGRVATTSGFLTTT